MPNRRKTNPHVFIVRNELMNINQSAESTMEKELSNYSILEMRDHLNLLREVCNKSDWSYCTYFIEKAEEALVLLDLNKIRF